MIWFIWKLLLAVAGLMLGVSNAKLDDASSKKFIDNWKKFAQAVLTPNATCYKTFTDYGNMKVADAENKRCDVIISREGEPNACIRIIEEKAPYCSVTYDKSFTITLKDPVNFCPDALSSLQMLLASTSARMACSVSLPTATDVPRHMFVDAQLREKKKMDLEFPSEPELPLNDWPHRAVGGLMLMRRGWQPRSYGHRLLAAAADPRYQAELMLQWMASPRLSENVLSLADSMLFTQAVCSSKAHCAGSAACQGYMDAECRCHPAVQPPVSCMTSSEDTPDCDATSGSRSACPYRAVVGADLELRAHPGCKQLIAVANGLTDVHRDLRRFLEAERYPWQHFVVTILACPGSGGRLSDVTVGFPEAYRNQLRRAGLPADRDVLCETLRVYITNAEAQVRGSDSRVTHETLCLDNLVLFPIAHLARPRRPPPATPVARDAVHLWLGPPPKDISVDLSQLVVKLYSMPPGLTPLTPSKMVLELNAEKIPVEECVVEIKAEHKPHTTPADNTTTTTTFIPPNISSDTAAMTAEDVTAASTGSVFGIATLLLLLAYCMCQRTAGGGDWESDSSWSESPASWTTSSTSSWTTTPSSSADRYSTESFDFERDAHLAGDRATLEYMRRVQEEALRRRRLQMSFKDYSR